MFRLSALLPVALPACLALVAFSAQGPSPACSAEDGIALWRKTDGQGRACASCHSPDGIELVAYGYDEATFRRRAEPHLGKENAAKLATYLIGLRKHLGFKTLLDPMNSRPMQPDGSAYPGATPQERDRAFALNLDKVAPALMIDRVGTLDQAKKGLAEMLALDPYKLRIGIVLNRLSEDKFHGEEHASLAHWIPDVPPLPYSPELEEAQGRYLADPSEANLRALDAFLAKAWSRMLQPTQAIALQKARSLLVFQHFLRTGVLLSDLQGIPNPNLAPPNPYWELGDLARIYSNSSAKGIGMPADVIEKKTGGPSLSEQLKDMRLPWLWLGWMADPGLQRTSYDRRTRFADWFAELLLEDGPYPAHTALMLTKKMACEGFDKASWGSNAPQHLVINYSWLLREDNWMRYRPAEPQYRAAFDRFMLNSFRMFGLLQLDELKRTGVTYLRDPLIQQLKEMERAAATIDPADAKEDGLIFDPAIEAVKKARFVPT
ncbi:MAG TPA: hypothetical protein VHE55_14430 [Fimbriimonadaceae bacterium]|nr:hypothetical protein [Fimbriimonadaceae bacterium]